MRRHLQLAQVTQSSVQPDLEYFQEWGIYKSVPAFHHLHHTKHLPYIYSETTLLEVKTTTPCPVAAGPAKKYVLFFLIHLL